MGLSLLSYHPASDPFHAVFRIMRILLSTDEKEFEVDEIRILDFLTLFPQLIPHVRLPASMVSWRSRFKKLSNKYWYDGDRVLVFNQLISVQNSALTMMSGADWISQTKLTDGVVCVSEFGLQEFEQMRRFFDEEPNIDQFINEIIEAVPFSGKNGLKDRTGLLSYKYDVG